MKIIVQGYRFCEDIGTGGSKGCSCWLTEQITSLLPEDADPDRVGMYVASSDAGVDVSVSFWKSAIAEGVDFVNPRDFHWTLASSMAAHAAAETGIRGPCFTLVGGSEAGIAVLSHGIDDLHGGTIDLGLIGGMDPGGACSHTGKRSAAVIALVLGDERAVAAVEPVAAPHKMEVSGDAAEPFMRICQAIEKGADICVGAPYEKGYKVLNVR